MAHCPVIGHLSLLAWVMPAYHVARTHIGRPKHLMPSVSLGIID
jgi:hypothetical protein